MCGVRRSAVQQMRETAKKMPGKITIKQAELLAGIANVPATQLNEMPKWAASCLIDSVTPKDDTPASDICQAGPYGLYDKA